VECNACDGSVSPTVGTIFEGREEEEEIRRIQKIKIGKKRVRGHEPTHHWKNILRDDEPKVYGRSRENEPEPFYDDADDDENPETPKETPKDTMGLRTPRSFWVFREFWGSGQATCGAQ